MSNDYQANIDWREVDPEMVRTIMSQGENYLKSQLDISLAADRRAITLGGFFVTVVIATAGAAIASYKNVPLLLAGLSTSACLLYATWCCFWSARPIPFYSPGNQPKEWWPVRKEPLAQVIGGETENYQKWIEHNERCLEENAKALELGWRFAETAPVVGLVVWAITVAFI